MRDTELYAQILGVTAPWRVTSVRMESAENRISIEIGYDPDANTPCPKCSRAVKRHDHRRREWRHLETVQLNYAKPTWCYLELGVPASTITYDLMQKLVS